MALGEIFMEIEDRVVEEKNLERLENLVEILHEEGSKSVSKASCGVHSKVSCLCERERERDAKEAIRSFVGSVGICLYAIRLNKNIDVDVANPSATNRPSLMERRATSIYL
ncbi:unnamed protein product [Brassica napus]|uniref:(rape) hypothetical protein n=1 Tax=Brassica napus TaxID=3708 RepID=A0A817B1Z6_BRANA|nr:unnamed protein product [Brassica napus]